VHEVSKGSPVYLVCATGARSLDAITFLRAIGYDALSVAGGLGSQHRDGLVQTDLHVAMVPALGKVAEGGKRLDAASTQSLHFLYPGGYSHKVPTV